MNKLQELLIKKMKIIILLSYLILIQIHSISQVCINSATIQSPQQFNNTTSQTISGLRITNSNGSCITITNSSNIIIENCIFSSYNSEAIIIENSSNITIRNCIFKDIGNGIYALNSTGVKISYNQFLNLRKFGARGQFVQFNNVFGIGNEILYNVGENIIGNSSSEDLVNIYKSNGTAANPILIKGNRFRGGGPSS